MTKHERGRRRGLIDLTRHHAANVGQSEQNPRAGRAFPVGSAVGRQPGDVGARAEITGRRDEICREVPYASRVDVGDENGIAGDAERCCDDERQEPSFVFIGKHRSNTIDDRTPQVD